MSMQTVNIYLGVLHCHTDRDLAVVWSSWDTGGKVGRDRVGPPTWSHGRCSEDVRYDHHSLCGQIHGGDSLPMLPAHVQLL